jgi:hypothetical protein
MGMWIGRNRKARVTYGFDEIALVPGRVTINPNEVDITFRLPRKAAEPLELKIPILASAMDGVVDVGFAIAMNKLGGLAVLNLEGVQTRYKNPPEVLQKIVAAGSHCGTCAPDQGRRCCSRREFHSSARSGIWQDRARSWRGRFRCAEHGFHRPSHFVGVQVARS